MLVCIILISFFFKTSLNIGLWKNKTELNRGDKSKGAVMSYDPTTNEISTMASLGGNPHNGCDILIKEDRGAPVQLNNGLTHGNLLQIV
ncbi:hypothetical protein DWB61_15130 [Ancylomarina euxinus]|uniref:Uncharacterized protein n=1 Tax=Ancylomarina euxinus TaxID=2283627 RepID=A0A425XXU4_9BACT|nr:hypothetical protein DWB61_15130 [Ancylomarina euxinus]